MTEIDRPWIRKPDQKWAPPHPEPRGLYSAENINEGLRAMHQEAVILGVKKGVAFLSVWPFFSVDPRVAFRVIQTLERDRDPDSEVDLGTNYFGVAMSKLAYMLSTRTNSGSGVRPVKYGEVAYKGGVMLTTEDGSGIYVGYSGGTEEQDLQIAIKGLTTFVELAEKTP